MTWIRIDDGYADHPKLCRVGPLGLALQTRAFCYAGRFLTDGFLPADVVPSLVVGLGKSADEWASVMVGAGLWETQAGGYVVHDYLDYNPSRAEVLEARRVADERARKGGMARAEQAKRERGRFVRNQPSNQPDTSRQAGGKLVESHQPEHQPKTRSPSPSPLKKREDVAPSVPSGAAPTEKARKGNGRVPEGYQEAVDHWFGVFEMTQGTKPHFDQAEGACLKKLLGAHSLAHVKAVMSHMPRSRLRHIRDRHALTIHALAGSWNELWSEYRQRAAEEGEPIP